MGKKTFTGKQNEKQEVKQENTAWIALAKEPKEVVLKLAKNMYDNVFNENQRLQSNIYELTNEHTFLIEKYNMRKVLITKLNAEIELLQYEIDAFTPLIDDDDLPSDFLECLNP